MREREKKKIIEYVKELRERKDLMEQIKQSVINADCESVIL